MKDMWDWSFKEEPKQPQKPEPENQKNAELKQHPPLRQRISEIKKLKLKGGGEESDLHQKTR